MTTTTRPKDQHTPTPWRLSPPIGEGNIQIQSDRTNEYGNFILAEVPNRIITDSINAAFIVRAANAHEALVEALKDIIHQYEKSLVGCGPDLADSIRIIGKNALALAEGKGDL